MTVPHQHAYAGAGDNSPVRLPPNLWAAYIAILPVLRLLGFACGLRADEVDDLTQDLFLDLVKWWPDIRTSPTGWLVRAARRRANRHHRRRRDAMTRSWEGTAEPVARTDERAVGITVIEWEDALHALPEDERRVLRLRLAGVSRERVPELTGVTHRQARVLFRKAVARLRRLFS